MKTANPGSAACHGAPANPGSGACHGAPAAKAETGR
jgi:hypothetical protein